MVDWKRVRMIAIHEGIGGVLGIAAFFFLGWGCLAGGSDAMVGLMLCGVAGVLGVFAYMAFKIPEWWLLRKGKGKDARR